MTDLLLDCIHKVTEGGREGGKEGGRQKWMGKGAWMGVTEGWTKGVEEGGREGLAVMGGALGCEVPAWGCGLFHLSPSVRRVHRAPASRPC